MKRYGARLLTVICAALSAGLCRGPAAAQPAEAFYAGRDVSIVIGASMGGSYGLYAQLAARFLSRHIPGNPTIVVQSKPGAGGQTALRYMYNAAPRDGSVLAILGQAAVFDTLLSDNPGYDAGDFQYIGRFVNNDFVGLVAKRAGVASLEQARTKPVVFGAPGVKNGLAIGPALINRIAGTRFRVVVGYQGIAPIFQAIARGEVDAISTTVITPKYLQFLAAFERGADTGFNPIYTIALNRLPDLPDVPSIADMDMSEENRLFLQLFASQGLLGRTLAFPPGVPRERLEAFRDGFDAMMDDEAFLAQVRKSGVVLNPVSGVEIEDTVTRILTETPKEKVALAAKVYAEILAGLRK